MLKRVLAISPEFNEEFVLYQPWRQIHELGVRMNKKGIEFVIGTNTTNEDEINGLKILKLKQKNLRVLSKPSKEKISQLNPDIIYWQGNPLSGIYIKKNKIDNIPIILYISTVHMLWKEIKNLTLKEILQSNLLNFLTAFSPFKKLVCDLNHKNITGIIVSNNTIKERLLQLGVKNDKIITAPLCFEADFIKLNQKNDINKPFTICYLGPSPSIRGTDILLDVVEMFKKNNLTIHLDFLLRSTNPEKEKIFFTEKCNKKGISELVTIKAGILDRYTISKEIMNSDVVVIPTKFVWNEPPLAILEAMMLGKAVVTTNVCGIPELITNNGFTVNPNKLSFYECLKMLYDNPKLREEVGNRAKEFTQSLPGWDEMTNWTINILESFARKHNES